MRRTSMLVVVVLLFSSSLFAAGPRRIQLENWSVPRNIGTDAAISGRATFVAVDPCRIVDTRGAAGAYGGPALVAAGTRTFNIPGGPCTGIPVAAAYSLNLTVVNYHAGGGFVAAYPSGGARPLISTVTFGPDPAFAVANAAIVPPNGAGSIDVYASQSTHLIIDINGYFIEPAVTSVVAGTGISVTGTNAVTIGINTSGATSGQALTYDGASTGWSNVINGVTAGTGLTGGGTSGTVSLNVAFAGSGSANTAARSDHTHYARTIIVSPGATPADGGTALLNAMAAIIDNAAAKTYLLKIEPGVYDLGTSSLMMKPYVDIEGSGELATKITAGGQSSFGLGTVVGSDNAEIRSLTVESLGAGQSYAFGMYITNASTRVRQVSFIVSGGTSNNYGMYVSGGAPLIDRVTTDVTGGGNACLGILLGNDTTAVVSHSTLKCTNAGNVTLGLYASSSPSSTPTVRDTISVASGGSTAAAFADFSSGLTLSNVTGTASGGTSNYGLWTSGTSGTILVDRSTLSGTTNAVKGSAGVTIRIGATKLVGGVSASGATTTCAGVYDGAYAFSATTCP